jgi:DNA replicative helicase MCM subunit Mcm2 (Cdc46/Mcm family)
MSNNNNNNNNNIENMNKSAGYWYYSIGVNPIPADTRKKKTYVKWSEWQIKSLPEQQFNEWVDTGAFSQGIAIIPGKVWRGPNEGKYLVFIDCDNKKAIDEICTNRNGEVTTLERFAEKFIVEQHRDNPNKAHIYFYSEIPFTKKSSDILEIEMGKQKEQVDIPLFEVKGKGSHGIAYCTPSVHEDGYPYEIIGTADPITLDRKNSEELEMRLDTICKKYNLHYLEYDDGKGTSKIPMASLFEGDFEIHRGNNRHEALMRIMESLILRNRKILKPEIIKKVAQDWNQNHCKPPLETEEFDKQWKAANEYVVKLLKQQGQEPTEKEREAAKQIENLTEERNSLLTEKFQNEKHDLPTLSISQLGIDHLKQHVVVTGTVIGLSELVPSWDMVKWLCKMCGFKNNSDRFDKSKPPKTCEFCSENQGFLPELDLDKVGPKLNQQTILLQDGAQTLSCILTGTQDQMWKVKPGQKVQALGIQKYETHFNKRLGKNEWTKFFELLDIKPIAGLDIAYTEKDVERFKQLVSLYPNFIEEVLLPSFAPHIRGDMRDCKLVCIYTLASQGLERPFNSILLGPPARGKTQLTEYSADISHYGNLTTFVNTSIAGLTSETIRDPVSGAMLAKPGILATYSFAAFTDINGAIHNAEGKKLLLSLNDALERKVVTSGKAGGAQNFEGRCAVLMDSNNFAATWYYGEPLQHNMQFIPKSFWSRLDFTAVVPEKTTDEHHEQVGDANYESYRQKQNPIQLHEGDWTDEETGAPRLGFESLRKFFFYIVKEQPLPELPDDKELREYFASNYVQVMKYDYEYLIDGRYNRTVMLLARVRARLLLKETADRTDLEHAIRFVNKCKNIETIIPKTGTKDGNFLVGVSSKEELSEEETNKIRQWVAGCKKAMEESEYMSEDGRKYFTKNQLADILSTADKSLWRERDIISMHVDRCMHEGKMLQMNGNLYTWLEEE